MKSLGHLDCVSLVFQSERFFSDCGQTKDQIKYLKKCRSVFKSDTNFREISSVQEETQLFQLMYIRVFFYGEVTFFNT